MKKAYLKLIKLMLVTSLSTISINKGMKAYEDYMREPAMNLSIKNNGNIDFGEFPKKAYKYEMIRVCQRDKILKELELVVEKYASICCIDKVSILEIIKLNTNNFDSDSFVWNKNIIGTNETYNDFISQVFFLVWDIYVHPNNYKEHNIKYCYDIEPCVGDITIREFVYETADLVGVDRDMALGIACLESYYFEQMAGNDSYGTGLRFNNIYQGIIYGISNLKVNYIDCGLTTLDSMAAKHCPPNKDIWASSVKAVIKNVNTNRKIYDEYDKELVYISR